ncbi:MAG: HAD family phosphatase, partial [Planctomycetes bacterium]|nr:HAD family phosphatase [Planctomycetota bacterium]
VSAIVCGADVAHGKPDPQVFTLTCERMGLPASRCVVVEDAPAGIQAARAAGTRAVAVLIYHPSEAFDGADLLVDRLADLSVAKLLSLVMD